MEVVSLIGIIIALIFMNYSIYRGLGLPLACIIGTLFIWLTSGINLFDGWSSSMESLAPQFTVFLPVYLFGAILGLLYSKSGAAASIGLAFFRPFKNARNQTVKMMGTIFMFFLMRVLISLSGMDNMALSITMVSLVLVLFQDLDMPRKYCNAFLMVSGTLYILIPGAPSMINVILPQLLPGFTSMTCAGFRTLVMLVFIIGSTLWLTWMISRDMKKGEHFEPAKGVCVGDLRDPNVKRPFWLVAVLPLILIWVLSSFVQWPSWASLALGCVFAGILFIPYMKAPEGRKKFGWVVDELNRSAIQIPLYYTLSFLPAYAIVETSGWTLLTGWAASLATVIPPALGFGIISTLLVPIGSSAMIVNSALAMEVFVPAGLAVSTAGILTIVSNTVFDSLPNSPGMIMQADLLETPLKECYPSIFKTTVLLTGIIMVLTILVACIGWI